MMFPLLLALSAAAPVATPGTVTLEAGDDATSDDAPAFADAVQNALLRANFIPLPAPSHSRYIATFAVTNTEHGLVTSGTKGSGAVPGIGNWGAGVGIRLPKKDNVLRGLVVTTLQVTIVLRSDRQTMWSGTATTAQVEGTRAGAPETVAAKLADALIARFPRKLDGPLSIP